MITLTEDAVMHVREYLWKNGEAIGIRLAARAAGCSGYMHSVEFVIAPKYDDKMFVSRGVDIYVDPISLLLVSGTVMDYVTDGLNAGFKFDNPNYKNVCGCGESFSVDKEA